LQPADKFSRRHATIEPRRCKLIAYNYSDNHALEISSLWPGGGKRTIRKMPFPRVPSHDEFQDAVRILERDKQFGPHLKAKYLLPYRPMPPLLQDKKGKTTRERILNVGLLPTGNPAATHRIVSVNLSRGEIVPRAEAAPPGSMAEAVTCPGNLPPAADCPSTAQQVTEPLIIAWPDISPEWQFTVLAPRGSSGKNGSGIELREVYYKGRRVLAQAHVPILNVKYKDDKCGPFRDWLYAETCHNDASDALRVRG